MTDSDHLPEGLTNSELDERIEARITRAENRMIKYLIGLALGFLSGMVYAVLTLGRMAQRQDDYASRLATLEQLGAAPMQVAVGRLQTRLDANAELMLQLRMAMSRMEDDLRQMRVQPR